MTDIELPELPRLQVPRIDADIDLMDIRRLAKWAEGIAKDYAHPPAPENGELRRDANLRGYGCEK